MTTSMYCLYVGVDYTYIDINTLAQGIKSFLASQDCVHFYVCLCLCVYIHMYVCMYICVCVYMYVCLCLCVHMYVCIYVSMYMCVYVCMYLYLCVCVYICSGHSTTELHPI